MNAIEISRSALDVEWRRLEVSALNFANINTTRTADGGAYHPLRLLSGPATDFSAVLDHARVGLGPSGIAVLGIEAVANGERRVYEPAHPHADTSGFVTYPNIDHAGEMTMMMRASRAYEANLTAITIAQQMYRSAFDIGRQA